MICFNAFPVVGVLCFLLGIVVCFVAFVVMVVKAKKR